MSLSISFQLKSEPDGMGCFYGDVHVSDGRVLRLDVLPPVGVFRGKRMQEFPPLPDAYRVFVDGDEVAQVPDLRSVQDAVLTFAEREAGLDR